MVERKYKELDISCYLCSSYLHLAPYCDKFKNFEELTKLSFVNSNIIFNYLY